MRERGYSNNNLGGALSASTGVITGFGSRDEIYLTKETSKILKQIKEGVVEQHKTFELSGKIINV